MAASPQTHAQGTGVCCDSADPVSSHVCDAEAVRGLDSACAHECAADMVFPLLVELCGMLASSPAASYRVLHARLTRIPGFEAAGLVLVHAAVRWLRRGLPLLTPSELASLLEGPGGGASLGSPSPPSPPHPQYRQHPPRILGNRLFN